jgi:hypothetical protein
LTPECWRYSAASHRDCRQVLWAAVHDVLRASLAIKCARRDDLPAIEHSSPLKAAHHQVHVTLDPASSQLSPF